MTSKVSDIMSCQLTAMGMVNALGSDPLQITKRLVSDRELALTFDDGLIPNRRVPVGRVSELLPVVPEQLSSVRSRNLALTLLALGKIQSEISKSIAACGASRVGVVLGSSTSGIAEGENAIAELHRTGQRPENYSYTQQEMGTVARAVASTIGATGPVYTISTACSTSAKVFGSAKFLLENNLCDAVVTGGVDSLCRLTLNGFSSLDLISPEFTNPFSRNRMGITIGEGACFFLVTRTTGGVQLLGVGESSDAYHISSPDPEAKGAIRALRGGLEMAGCKPEDIWYVNLHGTGTAANDAMEAKAVHRVFGRETWCSSTKPLVGHMLGASGATEVGFCWLVLQRYLNDPDAGLQLPQHLYDREYDPEIEKVALVEEPTSLQRSGRPVCVSNSFGFGGSNCAVVLGV